MSKWRLPLQNLKTYITVNTSYIPLQQLAKSGDKEIWRSWGDDNEAMATVGCGSWEARVALTPFLAHQVEYSELYSILHYA